MQCFGRGWTQRPVQQSNTKAALPLGYPTVTSAWAEARQGFFLFDGLNCCFPLIHYGGKSLNGDAFRRVPVVFIIISWQEARLSCDGKEQELSSISITPSKLPVELFHFLPSLFSFLAEGCMLPAALSDEGKHLVVMFQSREEVMKPQSFCLRWPA